MWWLPSGGSGGTESEQVDRGGPVLPLLFPPHKGPVQGLTTGLVGAAAVWAPHFHQGSAHATLHLRAAEALTHCTRREAGDTSDTDDLGCESSEMQHWFRRL